MPPSARPWPPDLCRWHRAPRPPPLAHTTAVARTEEHNATPGCPCRGHITQTPSLLDRGKEDGGGKNRLKDGRGLSEVTSLSPPFLRHEGAVPVYGLSVGPNGWPHTCTHPCHKEEKDLAWPVQWAASQGHRKTDWSHSVLCVCIPVFRKTKQLKSNCICHIYVFSRCYCWCS